MQRNHIGSSNSLFSFEIEPSITISQGDYEEVHLVLEFPPSEYLFDLGSSTQLRLLISENISLDNKRHILHSQG